MRPICNRQSLLPGFLAPEWSGLPHLLPGVGFTVAGALPATNAALVSAGGELGLAGGFSVFGGFDSELSDRAQSYVGSGGCKFLW
jgi:uncharacterized protein with beta-barrel porin domain